MNGQIAVITGASSGIGMELARLFASDGYELIITARRLDRLQQLAKTLSEAHNIKVHVIQMDIAQPSSATELWHAISRITRHIDVLVNNAGFGDACSFIEDSPENIGRMIHLNIASLTLLTRLALPNMITKGHGKILNVSSLAGFQPGGPGMAVYYATKSYVLSFSRAIRRELDGTGVTITTLCPGPTQTGFEITAGAQNTLLFHWTKPMPASVVARAGYRGMQLGRRIVIPGILNRLLAASAGFSPSVIALEINRFLLADRSR